MSIEYIIPFFDLFKDENIPLWLSLGIISFGLFFFIIYYFHVYLRTRHSLRKARKSLEKIKGYAQFYDRYASLDSVFTDSGLKHIWDEFKKTLVFPSKYEQEKIIRNTIRPQKYFNFENLTQRYNISFYQALPNIIVGFGLLLTFCGLVSAIYLTGESIITQHSDDVVAHTGNLKNALDSLLKVAAFKFLTSIAGLVSSLVLTLEIRICNGNLRTEYNKLNTHLERNLLFVSQEQLLSRQHEISLRQLDSFQNYSNLMQQFTADIARENAQKTALAINAVLKMYLAGAEEKVEPVIQLLASKIEAATKATMTHLVKEFSATLKGETRSEMQALTASLTHSQQVLEQLSSSLNQARQTIDGAILNSAATMQAALDTLGETFKAKAETLGQSLGESLTKSTQGLEERILSVADKFEAASGKVQTNLTQASNTVATTFQQAASDLTSSVAKEANLCQANFKALAESINQTLSQEAESLTQASQTLLNATQRAQEDLQNNFVSYVEDLHNASQNQQTILSDALKQASSKLAEQLTLSAANLQATEEAISQTLTSAVSAACANFESAVNAQANSLKAKDELTQEAFHKAAAILESSAKHLAEEFKLAQENFHLAEQEALQALQGLSAELAKNVLTNSEFVENNLAKYGQTLEAKSLETSKHLTDLETTLCETMTKSLGQMRLVQEEWLNQSLATISNKLTASLNQVEAGTKDLDQRLVQALTTNNDNFKQILENFAEKNSVKLLEDTKIMQSALEKTQESFERNLAKTHEIWSNSFKELLEKVKPEVTKTSRKKTAVDPEKKESENKDPNETAPSKSKRRT